MDFRLSNEQRDIINAAKEFATKEFEEVSYEFDRDESLIWESGKRPAI